MSGRNSRTCLETNLPTGIGQPKAAASYHSRSAGFCALLHRKRCWKCCSGDRADVDLWRLSFTVPYVLSQHVKD
ncbi:hypothetical protein NDU88_001397 [Pleurodeles waltl]|uniref:Uncharacterized protein n=1 Tax=Pleurodeles waltl TaxID=8319 RepID=A0AAV7W1C8_PLEWA|nr:hypothetical protein NDU88_001392 [Pleurodeles waltl]KAJ1205975.1 hypothetical protein NDU88_001393 [Pleurodeles waltl]KAJ1205977.1 hypothetical protein NDU88_001395 [Pleurodeles waltl]KAJ1205979.1 hypothetical protein NDU88_001397 [Pleurodeles waltl]